LVLAPTAASGQHWICTWWGQGPFCENSFAARMLSNGENNWALC
jgi:hypothetical protein